MSESPNWHFRAAYKAARMFPILILVAGSCFPTELGAVELPVAARVENIGSYCTWASLDTLARANGIPRLCGVMEERRKQNESQPDPGYDDKIEEELKARGVRYELRPQWSYDRDLLERYAAKHGVAVSLMAGNPWSIGCHTIVVTRYDKVWVEFYDSSKPVDANKQPKIWRCGRTWFDQWWLGSSVVVFPGGKPKELSGAMASSEPSGAKNQEPGAK
jgi:hypothetical protein